jgi:diguanylate cyclase (GGDEF)-like protein
MLISLKRYLDRDRQLENSDGLLGQVVHALLSAVGTHAIQIAPGDFKEFRDEILELDGKLSQFKTISPEYLVLIGSACERIEDYGRRMTKVAKMQSGELGRMVEMLTKTVSTLSSSDETAIRNLRTIARQIERIQAVEDLRIIKERLSDCLEAVEQESARKRVESATVLAKMRQQLESSAARITGRSREGASRDALTGLQSREEAERFLLNAQESSPHLCVAVFVVLRLQLINSRFGYKAGDELLKHFGGYLTDKMTAADRVFRWSGPAFVVALDRTSSVGEIRRELVAISSQRVEKTLQTGTRVALVTIASAWTLFSLCDVRNRDDLRTKIDEFAQISGGPDPDDAKQSTGR